MSLCLAVRWSASLVLLCWMVAATISLIPTSIISRLACVILKGEAVGIREKQQSLQCDTKGARFTFSDTFGHRSCSSLSVESTSCHKTVRSSASCKLTAIRIPCAIWSKWTQLDCLSSDCPSSGQSHVQHHGESFVRLRDSSAAGRGGQPRQHVGVTKHNAPVGLATSKSLSLLCDAGWCYQ